MALECPNCRAPVSLWRAFRTTAWGRFTCKTCGSVLGINVKRRFFALIPLTVWMVFLMSVVGMRQYGTAWMAAAYLASSLFIFYLFEDIVLIERRAFCCRKCGYELEGLPLPRCPECGTGFDPEEKQRIEERIGQPIPRARYRWVLVLLILLLVGTLILSITTIQCAKAPPRPAPAPQQPQAR